VARRRLGFWRRFAVVTVKPILVVMTRRTWRGMKHIPATGPVIIVANHISHADPLILAHFVYDAGRWPSFLAKASLFEVPGLGSVLRSAGQIPVSRGTVDAARALEAAAKVSDDRVAIIYPEGTISKQPDLWPMRGKTGAARLWMQTGAPVIPVITWGPQQIFDSRTKKLRVLRRSSVTVVAGPPVDLSAWVGAPPNAPTLQEITDHLMLTVRDLLAEVRGGTPPPLWTGAANQPAADS
jgi:1-acyl-sn-glycerol-3-phosphate acyltransferase